MDLFAYWRPLAQRPINWPRLLTVAFLPLVLVLAWLGLYRLGLMLLEALRGIL